MATQTKKLAAGFYLHISTGKFISAQPTDSTDIWNIYNDEDCCDEYAIGYHTKSQAVDILNDLCGFVPPLTCKITHHLYEYWKIVYNTENLGRKELIVHQEGLNWYMKHFKQLGYKVTKQRAK